MAKKVIALLGQPVYNEDSKAAEAILPGHLVDFDANGDLIKQLTAALKVSPSFALEREEMGKTIDIPYAINDTVKVGTFHQGQRVLAWAATGNNVTKGTMLESAGAGQLRILAAGVAVGEATESVDATSAAARITIQIV